MPFSVAKNTPGPRGRGANNKTKVLVVVELNEKNRPRFATMTVVDDFKEQTIEAVAQQRFAPGATVKTDGLRSFEVLQKLGYRHEPQPLNDPKKATACLPWVHIMITNAKELIRGTHKGVSKTYLQHYLNEFCYRLNRRFQPDKLFDRLLFACVQTSASQSD